jgi:hypothetical protein
MPDHLRGAPARRVLLRTLAATVVGVLSWPRAPLAQSPPAASTTARPAATGPTSARDRWADTAARLTASGVRRGDRATLSAVGALLDRALVAMPEEPLLQHHAGYAAYREAVLVMARASDDERARSEAGALLGRADSLLERSAGRLPLPETFALRASVIGMQIAVGRNPAAAMWLGPRANGAMDEALRLGPRNPRVLLLRGISAFNTPKIWGGGADRARTYLAESAQLFAADRPAPPLPSWGAAEVTSGSAAAGGRWGVRTRHARRTPERRPSNPTTRG